MTDAMDSGTSVSMGQGAFRVCRIRGIDIRVDASWLIIALLVLWSYWRLFDGRAAHAGVEAFVMAVAGALLFFGSILGHELAHALEAKHRGVHVESITLFVFGGVTKTSFDVRRPVDEFALTAVGPFTSFVLAASLGLIAFGSEALGWEAVAAVSGLVAWINLGLGAFNLLPGAPLDGGRILRAGVWWITRDRGKAVRAAARAGQLVGGAVMVLGLMQVFFVPAAFSGGLWLAFIGWFLLRAATAELGAAVLHQALEGLDAGRLVDARAPVAADDSVAAAIERFRTEPTDVLRVDDDSTTVGVVTVGDLRRVAPSGRATTTARDVMRPIDDVPFVRVDDDAASAVEQLDEKGIAAATESGRVVGVITVERVAVLARRAQQFGADEQTRLPA